MLKLSLDPTKINALFSLPERGMALDVNDPTPTYYVVCESVDGIEIHVGVQCFSPTDRLISVVKSRAAALCMAEKIAEQKGLSCLDYSIIGKRNHTR